ncbi:Odorant receptor 131-2 [Merluccius polli]|uniref:Odorant receptor 131-2 n=1 Tax=Merluccius polli TaxID=89951 RepID=A0AA47NTQ5_MERPO|nr:Odorant receptor 131-2 [Merluccius polli]
MTFLILDISSPPTLFSSFPLLSFSHFPTPYVSQHFYNCTLYVLYIHLVLNDMVMLSLSVTLQILTYTLRLRLTSCCVLLLILLTSNKNNPVNLACMAVERYIAVCRPLHHPQLCTVGRAYFLIALIWGVSFLPGLTDLLILLLASPGSQPVLSSMVMCYIGNVFNMPQHKTSQLTSEVLFLSMVSITLAVTYLKVLFAASAVSAASRASARKARNTILLHGVQLLICMLSFISPFISWPLIKAMPHQRTSILFTTFIITNILPRLLSPLIYGVRDQKFYTQLRLLFICRSCRPGEAERLKPTAGERVRPIEDNLNEAFIKNFITVFLSVIINFINGSFVYIYFRSQAFQRDPRYVLYIHLVLNDMVMLSLSVALQILTYTLRLTLTPCCILLLILLTTNKNSPVNLACMAVERYIAVCRPLHHPQLCTVGRAYFLIALIWGVSFLPGLTDLLILLLTSPGSPVFTRVFVCYTTYVFTSPQHQTNNLASQVLFLSMVSITLAVTYLKVLFAASAVSAASRASARKARNTILLHGVQLLICMLSFISPFISWPLIKAMPHQRTSILFTTFIITNILPRLLSPLIYGVRDQKFSTQLRLLFSCRSCTLGEGERLKPTAGERVRPMEGNRGRPTAGERGISKNIKSR